MTSDVRLETGGPNVWKLPFCKNDAAFVNYDNAALLHVQGSGRHQDAH